MTDRRTAILLLAATLLPACGTVSVATKPGTQVSRGAKITIVAPRFDPQNVTGQLEHLLLSQGFDLASEAVARDRIDTNIRQDFVGSSTVVAASTSKTTRLPSLLALRFSYNAYLDVFYWSFTRFNGTLIDLETGAVLASTSFSGDRSVTSVLEEIAAQLGAMAE